jgi:serine/threonine protein kinase
MKQIELKYSRSSQFNPFFDSVNRISVEDEPFAEGGFGRIYHCLGFNFGKPPVPQVVKIFKESAEGRDEHSWNTINRMQARIIDKVKEFKKNGEDFLEHYPALIALPQLVFSGILDGQTVRGYISSDLSALNYKSFDKIMEEEKYLNDFAERNMEDKFVMCYHLAKSFRLLESISFIHADLSADNIFVSMKQPYCAIIDFDSGAVVENQEDNPSTWGKPQDWLAPEISFQIGSDGDVININLFSDIWSVAVAMHYLLVCVPPYLFLQELSKNVFSQYTSKYTWPQVNETEPYYNDDNTGFYEYLLSFLNANIPEEVFIQFQNTFTKGVFEPPLRTSYYKWELIFKNLIPEECRIYSLPKKTVTVISNTPEIPVSNSIDNSKQLLKDYLNDLIRDIIFEGEKLERHLSFVKARVQKTDLNENDVIRELKDFIELYYNVIEDKIFTKFERTSLYIQGEMALIDKATVDELLAGYKEQ